MISYYMISYDMISYDVISYDMISYDMMSYDMISYDIISYDIISYDVIWACLVYIASPPGRGIRLKGWIPNGRMNFRDKAMRGWNIV